MTLAQRLTAQPPERRIRGALFWALLLTGLLALASCGGGGGGAGDADNGGSNSGGGNTGSQGQAGADYSPLTPGSHWSFDVGGSSLYQRVLAPRQEGGRNLSVVTSITRVGDSQSSEELLFEKTATALTAIPGPADDAMTQALGPVQVLRLPLTAGDQHTPVDRTLSAVEDLDGDGRAEDLHVRIVVTVLGFEALDTVAGRLENVARVRSVATQTARLSSTGTSVAVTVTQTDWYAPNVGLVHSVLETAGPGGEVLDTETQTITAFHVGDRRSSTLAPVVTQRSPAPNDVLRSWQVTAGFSLPMDPYSPAPQITVLGPNQQPLAGYSWWQDESTLAFVTTDSVGSGTFTVQLPANLLSLAGNALAGERSWQFTVDVDGPQVVSVTPASGATQVPITSAVQIVLDEEPDPSSLMAVTAEIRRGEHAVPIDQRWQGRTLTLTPREPLLYGAHYSLSLGGLVDQLGNATRPNGTSSGTFTASFATETQRLGLPSAWVESPGVFASEWGDFNADGRADLLVAEGLSSGSAWANRLRLYATQADGRPGPGQTLVESGCSIESFAAGDLDHDGRRDIVFTGGCQAQVLRQTAAGVYSAQVLTEDGERRSHFPSIVGRGHGQSAAIVLGRRNSLAVDALQTWLPDGQGRYQLGRLIPHDFRSVLRLQVGDINGDGLDDLLVLGERQGEASRSMAVLLQTAGDQWAAPRYTALPRCSQSERLRLADLNGDGRLDVVVLGCELGIERLLQAADGSFAAATPLATAGMPRALRVQDMNGDGRADLVVYHHHGIDGVLGLYLQHSDGSFGAETLHAVDTLDGYPPDALLVADANGDGRPDVFIGRQVMLQQTDASAAQGLRALRSPQALRAAGQTTQRTQALRATRQDQKAQTGP